MPKILVVDQDPELLRALRHALEKEFSVQCAMDGEAALKSLQMVQPEVMLLGPELPGLNVLSLLTILKRRADRPAVVLTSLGSGEEFNAALNRGEADGLVRRPFNVGELKNTLLNAIHERCHLKEMAQEYLHKLTRQ
jgi:two-component system, OmpR family, response regulator VicR